MLEAIHEAVARERIEKGFILMGIGALKQAVFRNLKVFPEEYPITAEERIYLEVPGPLELLSLTGYIVPNLEGKPHVHVHFSASRVINDNVAVYGGHLDYGAITHVKLAVGIGVLSGIDMGKKWVEERKTEDLWVGLKD